MTASRTAPPSLGPWDAAALIIGMVIGASIFRVPAGVFMYAGGPVLGLALWVLGGVLSFVGALCYCELATAYPRMGGDYVYLTRAYGSWLGFLFAWTRLTIILPANAGALSIVFANHAAHLFGWNAAAEIPIAIVAVGIVTVVNLAGVIFSKAVQNVLSAAKIAGLIGIVCAGVWSLSQGPPAQIAAHLEPPNRGLALVFVLFAFGGWNDAAFVAPEVRDHQRNVPRAMLYGVGAITLLYLAVNVAYLVGLGFSGVCTSSTPAADLIGRLVGPTAAGVMDLLVMIATLSAVNGMVFSGSRVFVVLGEDHRIFAALSRWNAARGAPVRALLVAGVLSVLLILLVGTPLAQWAVNGILQAVSRPPVSWERGGDAFDSIVAGASPVFYLLFGLTAVGLIVLRICDPHRARPFKVPGYPLTPVVFALTSFWMLWCSAEFAYENALPLCIAVALTILVGLVIYATGAGRRSTPVPAEDSETFPGDQ